MVCVGAATTPRPVEIWLAEGRRPASCGSCSKSLSRTVHVLQPSSDPSISLVWYSGRKYSELAFGILRSKAGIARQEMRPVIFLDMDGVVVTKASLKAGGLEAADRGCVAHLNNLVETADAEVVISSSWRITHSIESIRRVLCGAGFKWPDRVVDVTEHLVYRYENGVAVGRAERSDEIRVWLHEYPGRPFVVIDDDFEAEIAEHYIRVAGDAGLDANAVNAAIDILSRRAGGA